MMKKYINTFRYALKIPFNKQHVAALEKGILEEQKSPKRTDIINHLLSKFNRNTTYLEIGVRNPDANFNHIKAHKKYSVDPGLEFAENPVDFPLTSDAFFDQLSDGKVLDKAIKFDVVFIDGLHLAEQVDRDITNALEYIQDDGFIVLHDCNPPTSWHAREDYSDHLTPARGQWSGSTWKALMKYRTVSDLQSCCIDTDWGVGVISKTQKVGNSIETTNPFYEYTVLEKNRKELLNLISFEELKQRIED